MFLCSVHKKQLIKLMCFDRKINGNRDVKFLECDYLLLQRCMKLTLSVFESTLKLRTHSIFFTFCYIDS